MNLKISIEFFILVVLINSCTTSKNIVEKQYCTLECVYPSAYETVTSQVIVYTGNESTFNENRDKIEEIKISNPSLGKWIKQKDENCMSNIIDSCYSIVYKKEPLKERKLRILKDTVAIKDYKFTTYTRRNLVRESYSKDEKVLCEENLPKELIEELQKHLSERGYSNIETNGKFNLDTKIALLKFQSDNGLPSPGLSLITLQSLNIKWENYY